MRSAWQQTTLGEVCSKGGTIQTGPFGSQLHAEDYVPDGVPVVMPVNIGEGGVVEQAIARVLENDAQRLARHRMRPGDIVYSRRGDITRRALIKPIESGWLCGTGCLLARPGEGVDPEWLFYWLGTPWTHEFLRQRAVGATMPNLNTGILAELPVALPPLSEQRAIAGVLGALDDLIDANERLGLAARELAKAICLKALDGCPPTRLIDLATVRRGLSYKGAGLADNGAPMVNMGSAEDFGWLKRSGWKYYTADYKPHHVATTHDVLVVNTEQTWRNEILGWPLLIPDDVGEALFTHHVYKITPNEGREWAKLAIWGWLFAPAARELLTGAVRGTTVANLPIDALEKLPVPVPDRDSPALALAADLLRVAWSAELESAGIRATRDELLPLLMSGAVSPGEVAGCS